MRVWEGLQSKTGRRMHFLLGPTARGYGRRDEGTGSGSAPRAQSPVRVGGWGHLPQTFPRAQQSCSGKVGFGDGGRGRHRKATGRPRGPGGYLKVKKDMSSSAARAADANCAMWATVTAAACRSWKWRSGISPRIASHSVCVTRKATVSPVMSVSAS